MSRNHVTKSWLLRFGFFVFGVCGAFAIFLTTTAIKNKAQHKLHQKNKRLTCTWHVNTHKNKDICSPTSKQVGFFGGYHIYIYIYIQKIPRGGPPFIDRSSVSLAFWTHYVIIQRVLQHFSLFFFPLSLSLSLIYTEGVAVKAPCLTTMATKAALATATTTTTTTTT